MQRGNAEGALIVRIAQVVIDIPVREIDTHFDYVIPDGLPDITVGSCVLVPFGGRPAVGYVVSVEEGGLHGTCDLKAVEASLGGPYFDDVAADVARWLASEYLAPLSECLRLFTPPGGTPKAVRDVDESGESVWSIRRAGVGPVDDRWATLTENAALFKPRRGATMQRAVIDALHAGPVRVAELVAELGAVDGALRSLVKAGVVRTERRRRYRDVPARLHEAPRHRTLTEGQRVALARIEERLASAPGVIVLEGVTGSGKTEVYLRAIEAVLASGGCACVLVPEISLTPQTVGRFRSRFADSVAVVHSRLSPGERLDQWDRVAQGHARVVVGARSALFAPMRNVKLVIIDEEHEPSYKQGSAPRYHAVRVAERLCALRGAVLVLGSASPSMETRERCDAGRWHRVVLPERVECRPLPPVEVVDLGAEFAAGNRSMISRTLSAALVETCASHGKAILFLNRRGFASFILCRECGFVPVCESCSTSLTYHEVGDRLACHHCAAVRSVPVICPRCGSPYLRQFGAGTQRVEAELSTLLPRWPVVRMDADTTRGRGGHEKRLAEFEELASGVLLGTQMIAKGLDYPDVTLVGVIAADSSLNVPDFRAGERTFQLLEQVAGRAGRGPDGGRVIVQTYWPHHPAVRAVAAHNPRLFYEQESKVRQELGYPPFGRLANVLVWGRDERAVRLHASEAAEAIGVRAPDGWVILGPSPAPLARLRGAWRWHVLVKTPADADLSTPLREALAGLPPAPGVTLAPDIDPFDML